MTSIELRNGDKHEELCSNIMYDTCGCWAWWRSIKFPTYATFLGAGADCIFTIV